MIYIADGDVRRRFTRSQRNLLEDYAPLVGQWFIWNNLQEPPVLQFDSKRATLTELESFMRP